MSNNKVRMVIEFDINDEMLQESGLTAEQVLKDIYLNDDDVRDGFTIGTIIDGFENTSDFFLENGVVVEKSLAKDVLSLDEQIALAGAKEYELTLFQGKENEQIVRAMLTEEQVEMICKGISGALNSEYNIAFPDGSVLEVGCIDAIEILDGDCLLPGRQKDEEIERE